MDREEVLSISNEVLLGNISSTKVINIVTNYCIEMGKDPKLSVQFSTLLLKSNLIEPFFLTALQYYQKQFNICTITNKNNEIKLIY